jgi:hypothetical protein
MHATQTSTGGVPRTDTVASSHLSLPGKHSLLAALVAAETDRRLQAGGPADPDRQDRVVVEAEEITFRVGGASLTLTKENGGTLKIRAARVRIRAEEISSEATGTNAIAGEHVVAEAEMHADLLGKLIRIDGQCVKINS